MAGGWTKKRREEQRERMKLRAAQRREEKSIAAGAGTESDEVQSESAVLMVDKNGVVRILMPADVWSYNSKDGTVAYFQIGKVRVTVTKK